MASVRKLSDGRWQAQYRATPNGKRYTRTTRRKVDAQSWLDGEIAKLQTGTWSDPATGRMSVNDWLDTWMTGYASRRPNTVRSAKSHLDLIRAHFGEMRLASVRPSHVKTWIADLQSRGYSVSYVAGLHARLAQVMSDAVLDGVLGRSPCSGRTSPPTPTQRPYVASTAMIWAIHAAMPPHLRAAILLGAFAGLRTGEACGLRVSDIDFMRGIITPAVQFPNEPLKTEMAKTPVPIPEQMALELSAHVTRRPIADDTDAFLVNAWGRQLAPYALDRAIREARVKVPILPSGFRFHDLRHYFASLLISSGSDVKIVQYRLRHGSGAVTLDTYGHLWPDSDESTRAAVANVWRTATPDTAADLR